ncbi:MAG: DUF58 domain-containing protein [Treponema sp.]|jgi:uncharacterized protein (DUF58 family)|nr:DUF58 domain-containing protein [Treponema sp.]
MQTSELLRSITTLPIISYSLAEEMLAGNFRSIFKGQGMEFDEARHYEAGDDIRSIDWNASARFGSPFVKMYREERELTILILLDVSPSMHRGNIARQGLSPYEQALISAALIAFSAENTGQQAGAFLFDRDIEKVFPPHKGRRHIMSLVMAALQYQNQNFSRRDKNGSNIANALAGANRFLKRRSLVVIISDFFSINWENEMTNLCRKHDCIALRICDPPDLPYPGLITLEDPETGVKIEAPGGLESFYDNWVEWQKERSAHWESLCKRSGAAFLELSTVTDAASALIKFFGSRSQHRQRKRR